jgi:hypothetical protein
MARKQIAEQTKGVGKPKVGGPFDLVDHDGNKFTSDDLLGKYTLVRYFLEQGRTGLNGIIHVLKTLITERLTRRIIK